MISTGTVGYFYTLAKLTKPKIKQFTPTTPELDQAKEKLRKALFLEREAIKTLKQEHKAMQSLKADIADDDKDQNTLDLLQRLETKLSSLEHTCHGIDDKKLAELRMKLFSARRRIEKK